MRPPRASSIAAVLVACCLLAGGALRALSAGGIEAHLLVLATALPALGFVLRAPGPAARAALGLLLVACAALPSYPFAVWGLVAVAGAVVFATRCRKPLVTWELLLSGGIGVAASLVAGGALLKGAPHSLILVLGGLAWFVSARAKGESSRAGVGVATLGMLVGGLDFFGRSSGSAQVLALLALGWLWIGVWRRGRWWLLLPVLGVASLANSAGVFAGFGWGGLAGAALFASTLVAPASEERRLTLGLWVVAGALLVAAGVSVVSYLAAAHPHAGGVDFYYFLCIARDRVLCPEAVPDMQYVYSPGVYAFWGAAYRISASLDWFRGIMLALLVLDSALVLWIVGRATRTWALGALAACACLRFMTRFEGLEGTTEPLIAFVVLVGVSLWGGKTLEGGRGLGRAAVLGAALGLAIYAKQQGVFLALGALSFLLGPWARPRIDPRAIALGVGAIACVSLAGFYAEGKGSLPLERAFFLAGAYRTEATWLENLSQISAADPALIWMVLLGLVGSGFASARLIRREGAPLDWILLFSYVGFLGSLLQFTRRAYLHYAQVGLPFLVIAGALSAFTLWRRWDGSQNRGLALGIWGGLALCTVSLSPGGFGVRLPGEPKLAFPTRWERGVEADLELVAPEVERDSELLLLPPRRNVVHYRLGTRSVESPLSYGWGWEMGLRLKELPWPKIRYVLVLRREADRGKFWERYECEALERDLPRLGYKLRQRTSTLDLWERES
jgi:hypothetical protein